MTLPEVTAKIVHLRRHYHFGPLKIAMYLQGYHDIAISHSACGACSSASTRLGCRP